MTKHTATSADGTPIAYEMLGSGPALLFVDGALCYREFGPARPFAQELSSNYTVYIYDRRGRGDSGDKLPYSVEREVHDLQAVITAAGGDAFVCAVSSGAALALEAAASGVPIRKLAVYEAPYVGLKRVKGRDIDHLAELKRLLAEGNRGGAVSYFMVTIVGGPVFLPVVMRLMPKAWKKLKAISHTLPYDTTIMNGFTVPTARLVAITVPTLVMGGGKSPAKMLAAVKQVADALPNSQHQILDGQTHQVSEKALAPVLSEFFTT